MWDFPGSTSHDSAKRFREPCSFLLSLPRPSAALCWKNATNTARVDLQSFLGLLAKSWDFFLIWNREADKQITDFCDL